MVSGLRQTLEDSWIALRGRFFPFTASLFVIVLGSVFLLEYSDRIDSNMPLTAFALRIVALFFSSFAVMVIIRYTLAVVEGAPFGKKEIQALTPRWLSFIGATLTLLLVVLLGTIAFIVPGLYLLTRYGFVPHIIIDGEQSIRDAFKKSVSYTENRRWELFRVFLLVGVLNVLGAALFLVGLIITLPLSVVLMTKVYRAFKGAVEV